ncbi:DNA-directed DNA polymerase [Mucor circinelloides]
MVELSFRSQTYAVTGISIACLLTLWMLSSSNTRVALVPETVKIVPDQHRDVLYQQLPKDKNLCSSDDFNQGKWVHQSIGLESQNVDGINNFVGYHCNWDFPHRCYRRQEPASEFNRSKSIIDYAWQPDSCMVLPYQARDFSKHLSENPLLLVGDSITQLMFESMWCLLGQDLTSQNKDTQLSGGDTSMWVSQLVHRDLEYQDPAKITVAYIRSDYLVKLDDFSLIKPNEGEGYQIGVGSNFPWVHAIPRFKYIMINTGPHWHPDLKWGPNKDRKELLQAFKKGMSKVFDYLKQNVKADQRVWVRSTPYGHAKCSQYTSPSSHIVTPTGQQGEYEWDMFEQFDFVWKDMIEKEKDERFHFFNVSISNYRGDAHSQPDSDCLHTCLPGPVDDWNKFFYHQVVKLVNNA